MCVPVCDFHVVELVVVFLIVPVADAVGIIVLIVAIVVVVVDDVVVIVVVVVLVFALLLVVVVVADVVAVVVVVFLETGIDKVIACVIPVRHFLQDHLPVATSVFTASLCKVQHNMPTDDTASFRDIVDSR